MTMLPCRVFVFHVEQMRIVLGAIAPGLGWETVLVAAIRAYYDGTTQARWVQVKGEPQLIERNRRFERYSVLTSRDEVLSVIVREQVPLAEVDEPDPPEVVAAVERRATAVYLQQVVASA